MRNNNMVIKSTYTRLDDVSRTRSCKKEMRKSNTKI